MILAATTVPERTRATIKRSLVGEMARSVGPEGFERQERAVIGRPDSRADLPFISCPTLVLCGRDDAFMPPPLHEELADGIPGARLRIKPRAPCANGSKP